MKMFKNIFLTKEQKEVKNFVLKCRENAKLIKEVKQNQKLYPNISSFNFTRNAFYDKEWNELSIKARGLFIDTKKWKVVARGFDKFFNVDEREETKVENLGLFFGGNDVEVQVKENGYLGILSTIYNKKDKKINLIFGQKSRLCDPDDNITSYALWFKEIFDEIFLDSEKEKIALYLYEHNISALFEVILPDKDPHIINYDSSSIRSIALIKNKISFEELDIYNRDWNHLMFNRIVTKLNTIPGFLDISINNIINNSNYKNFTYNDDNIFNMNINMIEGLVLKDTVTGKRVKIKSSYYNFFKQLRGCLKRTQTMLTNSIFNKEESLTFEHIINDCRKFYDILPSSFKSDINVFPEFIEKIFIKYKEDDRYNYINMQNYIFNVKLYLTYIIASFGSADEYLNYISIHNNKFSNVIYFKSAFEEVMNKDIYSFNTPLKSISMTTEKDIWIVDLNKPIKNKIRIGKRTLESKQFFLKTKKMI